MRTHRAGPGGWYARGPEGARLIWLVTVVALGLLGCRQADEPLPLDAAAIEAIPDPVERLRALELAAYGGAWDPERLDLECAAFSDRELAQACERYLARPHLYRGSALGRAGLVVADPGAGCPEGCAGEPSLVDCVVAGSLSDETGPGCACLPDSLARDECWFRQADELRAQGSSASGRRAGAACLEAGALKGPCLHHQALYLGGRCASVDTAGLDGWRAIADDVAALEASVAHWDAFERQQLTDAVWAGALRCAFQLPVDFDPGLLGVLPTGARPHLRAAVAWHAVAALRGEPADLDAWRAAYQGYLETGQPPSSELEPVAIPAGPGEGWSRDSAAWALERERAGEGSCGPSRRYFGMGKRFWAEDPELDSDLCLLEAGGRVHPGARVELDRLAGHPDPQKSCTARSHSATTMRPG